MNKIRHITKEERILESYDNSVHYGYYRNLDQELNNLYNRAFEVHYELVDYIAIGITLFLLLCVIALIVLIVI